jgi:serine/threonine protein phosphatase PrpC
METGISHTKRGKECQDYSLHYDDRGMSVAVVADGHGDDNCFRSAKGSELAAKCALDGIRAFITRISPGVLKIIQQKRTLPRADFETKLADLIKHIIVSWHGKVEEDYTANPFTGAELEAVEDKYKQRYADKAKEYRHHAYGTTLIACALTGDYWFGIHIGDGRFTALYKDGSFDQPVPWDKRCYLNVTTSVCDDDAIESARFFYSPKTEKNLPLAVFLCSDGVDDNYPELDNEKHLFYKVYRKIALAFAEDGFDSTCKQIKDLANSFATKGKGDDTSIAGIIDTEALKVTAAVYQKQIDSETAAIEKAKAEEDKPLPDKAVIETLNTETENIKTGDKS